MGGTVAGTAGHDVSPSVGGLSVCSSKVADRRSMFTAVLVPLRVLARARARARKVSDKVQAPTVAAEGGDRGC
jgi:hypothetical protein